MQLSLPVKRFSSKWFRQWLMIVSGCIIMAAGYVLFINPYNIVPGGVYGIGIVLHYLYPDIMVGTYGLCMDVPLLLIGLRIFGRQFGGKTLVAAIITPLLMNGFTALIGSDPTQIFDGRINLSNDIFLSCLFGGALVGVGLGLMLKAHATSGGTDIISMIVNKYAHIPFAKAMLIVDSMVVIFGLVVLGDWLIPLYSLVTIFVISRMIDYMLEGGENDKMIFILSQKQQEIEDLVLNKLDRSGTYIKSRGMYSRTDKEMLFLVVARRQVVLVKDYIREIDPRAFMVIADAHEIYGEGFTSLQPETKKNETN